MLQVRSTVFFVTQSIFVMWGYEESGYYVLCIIFLNKDRYENTYVYISKCQQENIETYSKKSSKTI